MNKFVKMVPYVGEVPKTEEQLRKDFENFLKNPEVYNGNFFVMWKENDDTVNLESFRDVVDQIPSN